MSFELFENVNLQYNEIYCVPITWSSVVR